MSIEETTTHKQNDQLSIASRSTTNHKATKQSTMIDNNYNDFFTFVGAPLEAVLVSFAVTIIDVILSVLRRRPYCVHRQSNTSSHVGKSNNHLLLMQTSFPWRDWQGHLAIASFLHIPRWSKSRKCMSTTSCQLGSTLLFRNEKLPLLSESSG